MGIKEFAGMSDSEIEGEMSRLLNQWHPGAIADNIPIGSFYQMELTRRAVVRLRESSNRLESLTQALIALTIVLLVAALPPAVDAVGHWLRAPEAVPASHR